MITNLVKLKRNHCFDEFFLNIKCLFKIYSLFSVLIHVIYFDTCNICDLVLEKGSYGHFLCQNSEIFTYSTSTLH